MENTDKGTSSNNFRRIVQNEKTRRTVIERDGGLTLKLPLH